MDLTETLETRLAAKGIALGEAARRAGVGRVTLWRWINGHSVPRNPQARALARVLKRRDETLDEVTLWVLSASRLAVARSESPRESAAASA